jgi:hypothetical protein
MLRMASIGKTQKYLRYIKGVLMSSLPVLRNCYIMIFGLLSLLNFKEMQLKDLLQHFCYTDFIKYFSTNFARVKTV